MKLLTIIITISCFQVGGGLRSRTSSASNLSISSIGSLVDLHRSMSARSGLTPPPRFLSMKNDQGNQVITTSNQSLMFAQPCC